jgi:transposase
VQVIIELERQPNDGSVYVFCNGKRDRVKFIMWDRNGFLMGYKRLERGRFDFPVDGNGEVRISWEQLDMLMSGMPMVYLGKGAEKGILFS